MHTLQRREVQSGRHAGTQFFCECGAFFGFCYRETALRHASQVSDDHRTHVRQALRYHCAELSFPLLEPLMQSPEGENAVIAVLSAQMKGKKA